MSTWFVCRHPGAIEWMKNQPIKIDHWETHLDVSKITKTDKVIGVLPMEMAADVCQKGAAFYALSFSSSAGLRGKELSKELLSEFNCRLVQFKVEKVTGNL